jgi:hypothetical protein
MKEEAAIMTCSILSGYPVNSFAVCDAAILTGSQTGETGGT